PIGQLLFAKCSHRRVVGSMSTTIQRRTALGRITGSTAHVCPAGPTRIFFRVRESTEGPRGGIRQCGRKRSDQCTLPRGKGRCAGGTADEETYMKSFTFGLALVELVLVLMAIR